MKKYKSFLLTNKYHELLDFLISEGVIEYSDDFLKRLHKISSPVSSFLLDIENDAHDDDDLKQNYIDLTDKEDVVSFISQKKHDSIEDRVGVDDPYSVKGRSEIKVGRLVRSLSTLADQKLTDKEIETFVNEFKSKTFLRTEKFELVSGEDIKFWYNGDNYKDGDGPLNNSCMRNADSEYFDMYANSSSCKLLILTVEESGEKKLVGRALVWRLYKSTFEGVTHFMDRIYCRKESDENKFYKYADDNGWLKKKFNNSSDNHGLYFKIGNKELKGRIIVRISGCEYYPFVDTLAFLNEPEDRISNVGYKGGWILDSQDGDKDKCSSCSGFGIGCYSCSSNDDPGQEECDECSGSGEKTCGVCDGDGKVECECCDGIGLMDHDECDGEGCRVCRKTGKIKCDKCIKGKVECEYCENGVDGPCKECKGTGSTPCGVCDGKPCGDCVGLLDEH